MNPKAGIYKIINIVNNKVYIGSSYNLDKRRREHFNDLRNNRHCNIHLQLSYNKCGEEYFKWEVIEYIDIVDDIYNLKNNLLKREQYHIDSIQPFRDNGYNICPSSFSMLGVKRSKETINKLRDYALNKRTNEHKFKISQCNKGKNHPFYGKKLSEKHKNNISNGNKGKEFTEEHKKNISISAKGNIRWLGRKHSKETIEKMKHIKNNMSEETKKKMSESAKIKFFSEEHRRNIGISNKSHKKVKNLTTGEIFNSIREAANSYNICETGISQVCKGKRKTAGGYIWELVGGK